MRKIKNNEKVKVVCAFCHSDLGLYELQDLIDGKITCKKCQTLNQTMSIGIKCSKCGKMLGAIATGSGFTALKCYECNRFECFENKKSV